MPLASIHTAPALDSFTLLADHQSQTPTTFYNAKPVLHYHAVGVRALAAQACQSKLPIFNTELSTTSDHESEQVSSVVTVEAFISSESLTIFNTTTSTGISIPYPVISLHAIQRLEDPVDSSQQIQGLYMQLELSNTPDMSEDDNVDAVELILVPPPSSDPTKTSIQTLFEAVSACSNLHPDPLGTEEMGDTEGNSRIILEGSVGYDGVAGVLQGESNGGLPPPFPGSGGWITAENVSEYFDAAGNWIADGGGNETALGEGAGRVRVRDEVDESVDESVDGIAKNDVEESKRVRMD